MYTAIPPVTAAACVCCTCWAYLHSTKATEGQGFAAVPSALRGDLIKQLPQPATSHRPGHRSHTWHWHRHARLGDLQQHPPTPVRGSQMKHSFCTDKFTAAFGAELQWAGAPPCVSSCSLLLKVPSLQERRAWGLRPLTAPGLSSAVVVPPEDPSSAPWKSQSTRCPPEPSAPGGIIPAPMGPDLTRLCSDGSVSAPPALGSPSHHGQGCPCLGEPAVKAAAFRAGPAGCRPGPVRGGSAAAGAGSSSGGSAAGRGLAGKHAGSGPPAPPQDLASEGRGGAAAPAAAATGGGEPGRWSGGK